MSEEQRTVATLKACENTMAQIGNQREEMLAKIAQSLSVMLGSAVALVDGLGNVVGYQIKTGALHRVLGHMAGLDHPVTVPLCRTRIVLNHESSPWPLEGDAGAVAIHHPGTSCRRENQFGQCGCKDRCERNAGVAGRDGETKRDQTPMMGGEPNP